MLLSESQVIKTEAAERAALARQLRQASFAEEDVKRDQLQKALSESQSFTQIVIDYLQCVQKLREVQVRNAQLDKEAGELRSDNDSLLRTVEEAQRTTASPAELEEARSRTAELQAELLTVYKEKSTAAEGRATALQQLEIVRELNSQQASGLEKASLERQKLLEEIRLLRSETSKLSAARDLATKELETRATEIQSLQTRCSGLETENRDLVERFLSMKDSEIERMDQTARMCEDMVKNAKRQASEILATTRANIAREAANAATTNVVGGAAGTSQRGAATLETSLKQLNLAADALGGGALPAKILKQFPALHPGGCYALAMDTTGNTLASCGADRVVRLWDVARCSVISELRGAHEGVNDVAFTIDGKFILGAEDRAAVRIWDTKSGRLANIALTGHASKVTGVVTSPSDTDVVATVSADRTIKLWKLSTATCTRTFRVSTARRVAILPDSGLIVSGHIDGKLRFWDSRTTRTDAVKEIDLHPGREVYSVVSALAGGTVVTCGRGSTVCVVDTRQLRVRSRLSATGFQVEKTPWATPALSPAASHIVAGSEDGALYLWDLGTSSSPSSPVSSPSHLSPLATAAAANVPKVLRPPKPQRRALIQQQQEAAAVVACAWSPAGMPVVSSDRLGGVTFWGPEEETES
jgi:autophagy-related protein 16-1